MMFSKGFSFIEVIVSVLISSIIGIVLLQSMSQFSKAFSFVEKTTFLETQKAVIDRQWNRDFSGMFAPKKKEQPLQDERSDEQQPTAQEQQLQATKKDATQPEKEEFQPDPFLISKDGDKVKLFSCITSNPALLYGHLLPRIVRVVYKLIPSKEQEGLFTLVRQQSDNLDLKAFEEKDGKVRAYELATAIKTITIDAWVEKIQKQEKQKKPQQPAQQEKKTEQKEEPRTFVSWDEWGKIEAEEKKKYEPALVPAFVKITIVFMYNNREYEQTFWYAPLYDIRPVVIEGPSALLTDKERNGRKQAEEQYSKINEQLQDFNERVLVKKMEQRR